MKQLEKKTLLQSIMNEIQTMQKKHQEYVKSLKLEIERLNNQSMELQQTIESLQQQLNIYVNFEHTIGDVLSKARQNASMIENDAREESRILLEEANEEFLQKQRVLEKLLEKVHHLRMECGQLK